MSIGNAAHWTIISVVMLGVFAAAWFSPKRKRLPADEPMLRRLDLLQAALTVAGGGLVGVGIADGSWLSRLFVIGFALLALSAAIRSYIGKRAVRVGAD